MMKRPWTIQLAYAAYFGALVTVDAETLEEAIPAAIKEADESERWKSTDHTGDPHAVAACEGAACEGADQHPWDGPLSALLIPDRFTERGAPPVVTLTTLGPPARIDVSGGTVRLRFVDDAGTVTTEVSDPPPPPANKPVVTVSLDAHGKPHAQVQHEQGARADSGRLNRRLPARRRHSIHCHHEPPAARSPAGVRPDERGWGRGSVPALRVPSSSQRSRP